MTADVDKLQTAKEVPEGRTIFHEIMRRDMPAAEKATWRLADEAMVILIAGSETTASTLVAIMYELLSTPALLARLKAELAEAMPDPNQLPVASKLDSLPLLNASIQEAIRLYPGVTWRQDRTVPDEDLVLESSGGQTFVIPQGTTVGMTAPIINRHAGLYDEPDAFRPDRYLRNPELRRYNFSFSKGARQCIGINLAYQELQPFTAGIFRRYDLYDAAKAQQDGPTLELYQTTKADVDMHADYATPGPRPGSEGLRVRIRS